MKRKSDQETVKVGNNDYTIENGPNEDNGPAAPKKGRKNQALFGTILQ